MTRGWFVVALLPSLPFECSLDTSWICGESTDTAPQSPDPAETPPPKLTALATVEQGRQALAKSLATRKITDFEAFLDAETVVVEYDGDPAASGDGEKQELAYVLGAAAVAFPHATQLEAHRLVGAVPKAKAAAPSIDVLKVIAGESPFDPWLAALAVTPLTPEESLVAQLRDAHRGGK